MIELEGTTTTFYVTTSLNIWLAVLLTHRARNAHAKAAAAGAAATAAGVVLALLTDLDLVLLGVGPHLK